MYVKPKRLVSVSTCVDSAPVVEESLEWLKKCTTPELTHIVLWDNGSYEPLPKFQADLLIRMPYNVGANAVFHRMLPYLHDMKAEFVAYFHNDFIVQEEGWDKKVIEAFDNDPKLALLGMVGSDMQDETGGRGWGTRLSFIGGEIFRTGWTGGPASNHGAKSVGVQAAAGLDHCSMIFRVSALEQITPQEEYYGPGHYYDRACCCELIERGWRVATIDIACNHFSGGTGLCKAPGEHKGVRNRNDLYADWLVAQGVPPGENPDLTMYLESERRFVQKWRTEKNFIPFKVNSDYSVVKL